MKKYRRTRQRTEKQLVTSPSRDTMTPSTSPQDCPLSPKPQSPLHLIMPPASYSSASPSPPREGLLDPPRGSAPLCSTRSSHSALGSSSSKRYTQPCFFSFLFASSSSSSTSSFSSSSTSTSSLSSSPFSSSTSTTCSSSSSSTFSSFFSKSQIPWSSSTQRRHPYRNFLPASSFASKIGISPGTVVLQLVFLLSLCSRGICQGGKMHMSNKLYLSDILPENPAEYDKMLPPKVGDQPTIVYFHVTIMSIDSVNENSMSYGHDLDIYSENTVSSLNLHAGQYSGTFATDIFFAQSWKDHRLRLPENMTAEYRLLDMDWLSHLWRPDSFFKNAKEVNFQTMTVPNHYMWLYKDFTILYMVKLTLTLSCAMNFAIYPHDTQECSMQMESLSHTTDDLVFAWDLDVPLAVDERIELPQQMIISNTTVECNQVYSTGNFTCLEVVFKLKRRLGHFLFHTYLPTCLIVIMSWVSFWIRPEIAPARVTLGVTSILTLSTQHAKSQAALPPVSYIKAIDVFMSSCTVFVFMALMEYAVVNVILGDDNAKASKKHLQIPPPPPPPNLMSSKIDCSSFLQERAKKLAMEYPKISAQHFGHMKKLQEAKERRARAILMDRGSRYVFPISFAVLNCLYWITFWEYL